jgi:hypothetical protein
VPHRLVRDAVEGDGGAAGLEPIFIDTDWRRGADVPGLSAALTADTAHKHQGGLRGA